MHRILPSAQALAVATALTLVLAGCAADPAESAVGVNALMADPAAFVGEIAIAGVVQDVSPDSSAIALIDADEYETCGLTPCASAGVLPLYVPTSGQPAPSGAVYEGTPPPLEDHVVVIGTVRSGDSGLYFDVERIDRGSSTIITRQR